MIQTASSELNGVTQLDFDSHHQTFDFAHSNPILIKSRLVTFAACICMLSIGCCTVSDAGLSAARLESDQRRLVTVLIRPDVFFSPSQHILSTDRILATGGD